MATLSPVWRELFTSGSIENVQGTMGVYFSIAIKVIKSLKRVSSCMQREL